jgi:hypothetical protein
LSRFVAAKRVAGPLLWLAAAAALPAAAQQGPPDKRARQPAPTAAEPVPGAPAPSEQEMLDNGQAMFGAVQRCKPGTGDTIVVCGGPSSDRLSPELRRIAGTGQSTRDSIPPAPPASAMSLDRLPYNWMGRDGILFPRAKPNPLLEHVKAMEAARAAEEAAEQAAAE